ncbi:MAG: O-fucosyltransferase family protein [Bryobacteraceae bacterium]
MRASPLSLPGFTGLHIICEKDVGLFSLVHQVISQIPWALQERRIPIAYFRERTCYWTPGGYRDSDTVWEYYFEPIVPSHPASAIPQHIREAISLSPPDYLEPGYFADENVFVSCHIGNHPDLEGKTLFIPHQLHDPDDSVRRKGGVITRRFVRPRAYLVEKADRFFREHMNRRYVIGVHIRGTDAVSEQQLREALYRRESLQLPNYVKEIERLLKAEPEAAIFVASDAQSSVDYIRDAFGSRVIAYDSIRHLGGELAGRGPSGWLMPAYVTQDRVVAARNGEEAVIEYLLLSRCNYFVHNGSSLARMVLLKAPRLPDTNTYAGPPASLTLRRRARRRLGRTLLRLRNSALFTTELFEAAQFEAGWPEWRRNGHVVIAPGSGQARVTLSDTLSRSVPIDDSVTYRYSLEAFAEAPGSPVRLQIDWHDASGAFVQSSIETRQCGRRWQVYSVEMTPLPGTKTGTVVVGGHSSAPILVRSVSLKYPVCGLGDSFAWPSPRWLRRARTGLDRTLFRHRNKTLTVTELFEPGQFEAGWPDWCRNGHVEIAPGSGEARVTVSDTLFRRVPIDSSITYRYSLEAFSGEPGAWLRLQINWHDASGSFIGTTIKPRQCGPRWLVYSQDIKPPSRAKSGVVIVGAHTSAPVLVRSVSLKYTGPQP